MTRLRMLLVILGSAVFISTCAHRPQHPGLGPCAGEKHPDRPVVCVDDSAEELRVSHDPVVFHDVVSTNKAMSPGILWFTKSGRGNLEIRFRDEGCVRDMKCNGGRCIAHAARLDAVSEKRVCKYDVFVTGHPVLDPEGIIVRCCIASDLEPPG